MKPEVVEPRVYQMDRPMTERPSFTARSMTFQAQAPGFSETPSARIEPEPVQDLEAAPLGAARAQVHENYIIAQTGSGIVIVDQHAAHDGLSMKKLKAQMAESGVAAQALLIPEIVEMTENGIFFDGNC